MNKSYKKTYKGFIIWLILYCGGISLVGFLPFKGMSADLMSRLIYCLTLIGIVILMYIIYKTEAVYWFTGITYEQAVSAGSQRRKIYALKHLKLFGIFTLVYLIFSFIMQLTGAPSLVDLIFFTVSLIAVCIRTMFYKL